MYDDSWNSAGQRRLVAFMAAFLGLMLIGAILIGVESFESNRRAEADSAAIAASDESRTNAAIELAAQYSESRHRTADARRHADAAELALFRFLNERFVDSTEEAAVEPPRPVPGPTIQPNPEWTEMNRQLTELEQHRGELLLKLTPAHPTVQALDGQIAKTRDLLASMPSDLAIDPRDAAADSPGASEAVPPAPEAHSALFPQSPAMRRDYRNLLLAAGRARDAYRSAVELETTRWNACQHRSRSLIAMDRPGSFDLRQHDQPSPAAAGNRSIPIGAVATLTLLSLLAGALAARRVVRPAPTFKTAEEIEQTLGLPVLGRLGPELARPGRSAA